MSWTSELEAKEYTALEYKAKKEFPDIVFSTENKNTAPTHFPFVFFHELQTPALFNLEHNHKIGVNHYIEIQCFAEARNECKDIAEFAEDFMVSLGYNTTGYLLNTSEDYTSSAARYNRIIGDGEV